MASPSPSVRHLAAPSAQERTRIIELLETAFFNDGEVWVAGFNGQINAVAFWVRPGADFHIGLADDYFRRLPDDMREWLSHHFIPKYHELYSSSYPNGQQTRVQSWHLVLLGVQQSSQRRGLGKRLVNILRERADRQSQTITADVQTSAAVHFLNNAGFRYMGVKNVVVRV
ncbi:hypothetical protein BC834DRAFT_973815 [Gloeopeniophorella convolvens]|nr:hypothetical protein BC834DRAFT_973815 [Gloeopeniophorella convolvens]